LPRESLRPVLAAVAALAAPLLRNPVARRAIQLGLSGDVLSEFASTAIRDIEDVTPFVHAQDVARRSGLDALMTTQDRVYPVMNRDVARRLLLEERQRCFW
jgi:hypothetical protein